jgi:hypothetical protein
MPLARLVLLGLLCLAAPAGGEESPVPAARPAPVVTYRDDRLSVQAEDIPLADLLRDVGRASGSVVRGEPAPAPPVSARFDGVPMQEALTRLLGEQSFTLTYDEGGKLKTIDLRGGPQAAKPRPAEPPPSTPAGWPPSEAVQKATETVDAWTRSEERYPISGRLAQHLKAKDATFAQLAETAVTAEDRRVRTHALRAALRVLEGETEVRNAFLDTLDSVDDAFLVNYCRFFMKDRAEEFLSTMARHARMRALRTRARAVEEALRTAPPPAAG